MPELVSILIPAYKAEPFIAETLRNALAQTWPRKEIIVVDDGSPDRTYDVARRFECADVKVLRKENGGAPSARNTAFSLAQGEYIQWLDSDDLLHPEKIQLQLEGAESGLTSTTLLTAAWGQFLFGIDRAVFKPDQLWKDLSPVDWILTKFIHGVWMNPTVWLVSRNLTQLAGPWDSRLARSGNDDGEYACRVVRHSTGVRFMREARAYYRTNLGGLSWAMGANNEALQSLVYALEGEVEHLLHLEDSLRTRQAAFGYISAALPHFYGTDGVCLARLARFSQRLGFDLASPRPSWKYLPLHILAGPRVTKKVIINWRKVKVFVRRKLEQQLSPRVAS